MPKHFFFDLDNTLTRSRTHIEPEHATILARLAERADVIVVTGSQASQTKQQLEPELAGQYFVLAQNGNQAIHRDRSVLWERRPTPDQKAAITALIRKMISHLALDVKDADDLIEDRGSSIAYSTVGHHEDVAKKETYDPDHAKRRALLESFKADVDALQREHTIEVRTGGTTCLDFFEAGKHKGYNIGEFLKLMQWHKDDCLYVGDALFPGGNDETVVGVIPTRLVEDYHATYTYLSSILV